MNTLELWDALSKNPVTTNDFGGVFPSDLLPKIPEQKYYIVNDQAAGQMGNHWICMSFVECPEFFDSLGYSPSHYSNTLFEEYLIVNGPQYKYNSKRLQNFGSDTCGLFCLYYIYFKCMGYSLSDIVNSFSNNLRYNDNIVTSFILNKF